MINYHRYFCNSTLMIFSPASRCEKVEVGKNSAHISLICTKTTATWKHQSLNISSCRPISELLKYTDNASLKDVTLEFKSTESPLISLFTLWLLPPWKLKCCVSVETDELALSWRASGESEGKKARTANQEEKAFANPPIVSHLCRLSHPMLFICTKLTIKCMYPCTVG